jgi:arylsulfatase A-like enzyme
MEETTAKPNILFFITDQLRADHLGCYGNRTIRTNAIDSLAARGTTFERFHVASPVCQPNRATLATGRMPSVNGVRFNGISLSMTANTFVDLVRDAGWRTALIGKSHLQNITAQPPSLKVVGVPHGYRAPTAGYSEANKEDRYDPIYDQENGREWAANPTRDIRLPYYGFDHVELCSGHATRVHGTYTQWLRQRRPDGDSLRGPENALPHDYILPQAWRTSLPEQLYPTSYVAERTVAYLEEHVRRADGRPFFLQCSFPDPHHPFTPPGRYWDMYSPDDVALPETFHVGNRPLPPHVSALHAARDDGSRISNGQAAFAVSEREAREAIALTYGMIAMIDDAIAKILKCLNDLGLARDTMIVFTSDHGDLMGDHQLMLKGAFGYQGLVRVPFIWVEPSGAQAGKRTEALFSTLDIAASLLDRMRLAPYNGMQGRSLLPALAGKSNGHKEILIEYGSQRPLVGTSDPTAMRTLIVDERWRISCYRGVAWGELYDLNNDPLEMENLWDDRSCATTRGALTERLLQKVMELSDQSPRPTRSA